MEFEQAKIAEADGKEVLLVLLGRNITAIENKCMHRAGYPMARSMAKRSAALPWVDV
jgi:nitrite reductase/ring-hydroxylating ferredoxin subunit